MTKEALVDSAGKVLNDTDAPLKARFRALFALRGLGGADAIAYMTKSLEDPAAGALLKHEVAYCMGQMRDKNALPTLVRVLEDVGREAIVRHEAGEAIAAIGGLDAIDTLRKYCSDPVQEVADTCQIAVAKLEYETTQQYKNEEGRLSKNPYESVDPAPPLLENDVQNLRCILLDESKTLFERYRAMFSLRNIGSEESIIAIADGKQISVD
jgi:deoxyhypusine monooxygenase